MVKDVSLVLVEDRARRAHNLNSEELLRTFLSLDGIVYAVEVKDTVMEISHPAIPLIDRSVS